MKKSLIYFSVLLFSSCGFEPRCKLPVGGKLSYPLEIKQVGNQLIALNSDAAAGYCSGYISEYNMSSHSPAWVRNIYPAPITGELPHMLGGFDIRGDIMVVTDRYYSQVLLTHLEWYSNQCHPREDRGSCATQVVDSFRDPLQVAFLSSKAFIVSSSPLGTVKLYRKEGDRFAVSNTYTFTTSLTTTLTSFISPLSSGTAITYRENGKVYVLKLTEEALLTEGSRTFTFGSSEMGGIRQVIHVEDSLVLLATGPSLVLLTDMGLTPYRSIYPGKFPSSITFSKGVIAVTLQEEGKVSFFTYPGLDHITDVQTCDGPTKVIALTDSPADFAVACFYEHKIVGVTSGGEIVWELK